jgi:hypothetical protein
VTLTLKLALHSSFILLALTGCHGKEKREAVASAFAPLSEALRHLPNPNPRLIKQGLQNAKYIVARMQAVDVSRCPKDCREAWLPVVSGMARVVALEEKGNGKGLENLVKLFVGFEELKVQPLAGARMMASVDTADAPELVAARKELEQSINRFGIVLRRYAR